MANAIVIKFASHPRGPQSLNGRVFGRYSVDLLLMRSNAAGMAKLVCWSITPRPINALNAVVDPR